MEWKKLEFEAEDRKEAEVVRFENEGDSFVGRYVGFVEYERDGEKNIFYKFVDVDDEEIEFIMFPTSVLKTKMERVPLDAAVKIEYLGKKKSEKSKYSYKDFEFYLAQ